MGINQRGPSRMPQANRPAQTKTPQRPPLKPVPVQRKVNPKVPGVVPVKAAPVATAPGRGANPHLNQHSVHLQRAVQAKMAQPRLAPPPPVQPNRSNIGVGNRQNTPAPRLIAQAKMRNAVQAKRSASPALSSRVVQPASCWSGIADLFSSCWRSVCGPSSSAAPAAAPNRSQYVEIPDVKVAEVKVPEVKVPEVKVAIRQNPVSTTVDEKKTVKNIAYPSRLDGGYISSCALVIFCGVNNFDCFHPSGGIYTNHGMRNNPTRIYYIYKALKTDQPEYVDGYRQNAARFRASGGNAPLIFLGQTGINGNIMVELRSATEIDPWIGEWIQ